jgi:hypothetical protein
MKLTSTYYFTFCTRKCVGLTRFFKLKGEIGYSFLVSVKDLRVCVRGERGGEVMYDLSYAN